jgi:hypothetical protein
MNMATHDVTTTSVSAIVLNERGSQTKITVEIADDRGLDRKGDYVVSSTRGGHKWSSSFSPAEFAELKNLVNRFSSSSEDEEIMANSPEDI